MGSFDDILDIAVINRDTGDFVNPHTQDSGAQIAVVSNSSTLHIVDTNGNTKCLTGHSDIILAVEVFPGG